jgi:hypothetical protein
VDYLHRLRLSRHRQTPLLLQRVKAHAHGVSINFYSYSLT